MRRYLIAVAVILAVGIFGLGSSMAFGKDRVMCSPIDGTLVMSDGTPAAGLRVERTWEWNGKSGAAETVTDENGHFTFGTETAKSFLAGFVPHEATIQQTMTVYPETGAPVLIWEAMKRNYDLNGELKGTPLKIRCLADGEASAEGLFWSTCQLDN